MKKSELQSLIRAEVKRTLNEGTFNITNDAAALKALEDISANMSKWKGSEGAHFAELLNSVIDYLYSK